MAKRRNTVLCTIRDKHGSLGAPAVKCITSKWGKDACVCHTEAELVSDGRVKLLQLDDMALATARSVLKELAAEASEGEGQAMCDFEEWLRKREESGAGFNFVIDGPNVGYFVQAQEGTGLSHRQIDLLARHIQSTHNGSRVLIVMPSRYLGKAMPNHSGIHKLKRRKLVNGTLDEEAASEVVVSPEAQAVIEAWRRGDGGVCLWECPENDDWFWMFATLTSRCTPEAHGPLAVSNDQMRDHSAFRSLPGRSFETWRQSCVVGFDMDHPVDLATNEGRRDLPKMSVQSPPQATKGVQTETDTGWWHIPPREGAGPWLSLHVPV